MRTRRQQKKKKKKLRRGSPFESYRYSIEYLYILTQDVIEQLNGSHGAHGRVHRSVQIISPNLLRKWYFSPLLNFSLHLSSSTLVLWHPPPSLRGVQIRPLNMAKRKRLHQQVEDSNKDFKSSMRKQYQRINDTAALGDEKTSYRLMLEGQHGHNTVKLPVIK